MKLGVDLDDVVAICAVPYLRRFAEEYRVELPDEGELGWHILERYDDRVPPAERDRFRERVYAGTFFSELEPYANCSLALDRIVAAGHEVHFITARAERRRVVTETWLREKGLLHYAKTVRLKPRGDFRPDAPRGRYDALSSASFKVRVARELALDVFCEDDEVVAKALAEAGFRVWLFDHVWNRDLEHPNIERVGGWDDIADRILLNRALRSRA